MHPLQSAFPRWLLLACLTLLAACAAQQPAPVVDPEPLGPEVPAEPPPEPKLPPYAVQSGDTLSTIAAKFGLDYREIAALNGLRPPYRIDVGQVLDLNVDDMSEAQREQMMATLREDARRLNAAAAKPAQSAGTATAAGEAAGQAVLTTAAGAEAAEAEAEAAPVDVGGGWQWPVTGDVLAEFSNTDRKGIDLAGERGDPIYAAADGVVQHVYANVPTYGRLLVIQHGDQYLGFYGHSERILVEVGESVTRGQQVAEMGDSGADTVKLHFQLRKNARPMDPREVLPPR